MTTESQAGAPGRRPPTAPAHEIIDTVHARRPPMVPVDATLRL